MTLLAAERRFLEGLAALERRRHADAVGAFREALELARVGGDGNPAPRFLSYYGVGLARAGGSQWEALEAASAAVRREPGKASWWLNLGRVHLATGEPAEALRCFRRGLALSPDHRPLRGELIRLDPAGRARWRGADAVGSRRWPSRLPAARARLGTQPRDRARRAH